MNYKDHLNASSNWLSFKTRYYTGKNGDVLAWDFIERIGDRKAAIVVARTKKSESYILTRCFRPPFNDYIWEFPAGLIDKDESPAEAALRELEEETGYKANRLDKICSFYATPGFCDELLHAYYTDDVTESEASPEFDEHLEIEFYTLDQALDMVDRGEIQDGKTVASLFWLARKRLLAE